MKRTKEQKFIQKYNKAYGGILGCERRKRKQEPLPPTWLPKERIQRFRKGFREAYEWFDYPGYRIWQGISVDNARDAGITLKMLRTFYGKSRKSAVYDGSRQVVTPRQQAKIEEGYILHVWR